ncbi:hypothetical protein DM860_004561 [Cuscuta australis]|uniref:Methyltransferase n=1 Tax=Cuscuta australis TaxID=267555 RepID=A0A328E928_9ASTE|nr:hypothetical protein DM860_004561 [Cuscuta australis]
MGHLSIHSSSKRKPRRWRLLDLVTAFLFSAVFVFFLLLFTPLGDSLASSGRQSLLNSYEGAQQRRRLAALIEAGHKPPPIDVCAADYSHYMPCEDPRARREKHCVLPEDAPLCLIPQPGGYRAAVSWPESLHKIWHDNMPYEEIANWKGRGGGGMKEEGPYFTFPEHSPMFSDGAQPYIDKLKQYIPIAGGVLRTALDMESGAGSFGGFLLADDMLTLSLASKGSNKQQVQFALERGIPAFAATLGTYRLPFSAFSFDLVHCLKCSIPFTTHNATYFIEVDRLLRPGGYLVISGPPVQWPKQDKEWTDLQAVARSLCYELIVVDGNTAIWKKPNGDSCLQKNEFELELCDDSDEPSVAWYVKLKKCVSKCYSAKGNIAIGAIPKWPKRLMKASSRAAALKYGLDVFEADNRRWARRVAYYKKTLNLKLGTPAIRNIMDMNAFLGGFAAALSSDPVWVMNVIPARKPLTLDVIYDRGLIGVYHNWCEPFSTYPRSYDLIHVAAIQSLLKDPSSATSRCDLVDLLVEMDRILRPEGTVVFRDSPQVIRRLERITQAVRWTSSIHEDEPGSPGTEKILVATKKHWTSDSSSM